jgi:SAM-dependent methyltransferase
MTIGLNISDRSGKPLVNNTAEPAEVFEVDGHCPVCAGPARFVATDRWWRDSFGCSVCGSIPRERALMLTIDRWFPHWREAIVHESSPCHRSTSARLANQCPGYIGSQFFAEHHGQQVVNGIRNENLEQLSFPDESVDLHVTQDVFEHVLDPDAAFGEIGRTLRPGGMHAFTVPLVNKHRPTTTRARLEGGTIRNLLPPQYHGNPVGDGRALVVTDWGYDICERIQRASGLFTHMIHIDDLHHGIRAEYIEILVTVKPAH